MSPVKAGARVRTLGAYRDDRKRFVVHAGEKVTAFIELESAIRQEAP